MSNFNSMLKEFAEAQQAIEQVPVLRDEIRAKHEENLRLESARTKLTESLELARNDIANLQDKIARLEVERDDASFQEMATADRLHDLQSKIGALVDLAQELKPIPEPIVSEALSEIETSKDLPPQDGWKPYMKISNLIDTQPQDECATDPTSSASIPVGSTDEASPKYEDQQPNRHYDDNKSIDEPSTIDPGLGFMRPAPKPYADLRYWQKPQHVSTDDFVSGGGQAPSWYVKPTEHNEL